ncbi:hypothetical protein [Paenibacillus cymbidii]|uniref:hypothetical protein n=1 Tax=Paenibacillus cymbidii TaxID=1639034 RepID=UPI0010808775|nr:hypothetical protein [Paenibacillus cymbidii]
MATAANQSNLYERLAQLSEQELKLVTELVDQLAQRRLDNAGSQPAAITAPDRESAKKLKKMAMREGELVTLNSTEPPQRQ